MTRSRLQLLLGGLSLTRFFAEHFGKRWVLCDADPSAGLAELVSLADLEGLLFDRSERAEFIKVAGGRLGRTENAPARYCSPQEAVDEWLCGKSLVFNSIDHRLPAIGALCRDLESELKCRAWCNLYLTPAGSNAFATHYDTHDVFVIQLLGSKAWRVGMPAVDSPLPFQERKDGVEIAGTHQSHALRPAQVLYLPRGVLHDAVSDSELSCHLTVGIEPKTYLDLILTAVTIAADRDARYRRYIQPGTFAIQAADIAIAARLMAEVSAEDFRDAGSAFCELLASERRRAPAGVIRLLTEAENLSEDDSYQTVRNLMCSLSLSDSGDGIELAALGRSIAFARSAQAGLERCLTGRAFRIADLDAAAGHSRRVELVRRLLLEGIVEKLGPRDDNQPRLVDVINHIP